MPRLAFVVPAHGRLELSRICLRQLRRTCDALGENGITANAIVIADDENLDTATELGFATIERDNRFLSRKFNDGIQLACDPRYTPRPADYVVPCGSDDWIDYRILLRLPRRRRTVVGFQLCAFVNEAGSELALARVRYRGGVGIRIYQRGLLEPLGYRPADEDRVRGCDTSILLNVSKAAGGVDVVHWDSHPLQIVDFKSPEQNRNSYADVSVHATGIAFARWAERLAEVYPDEAVFEIREHYAAAVAA